ncbi:MAG: GNAT family protein [Pseudomonadota bacterium]
MNLEHWTPRPRPGEATLVGETVRLEPLDWSVHGQGLAEAVAGPANLAIWRYMPMGPFETQEEFERGFGGIVTARQWAPLVIHHRSDDQIMGTASYMRIREDHGSAEVGAVAFSDALKRTRLATEAMYLMACHIFDELGYRRYEWKCHHANGASNRAALRFGFKFEGVFRNDMVVKGRSRDTAWYAMTDDDWPHIKSGFEAWLAPENFDGVGNQHASLKDLREGRL